MKFTLIYDGPLPSGGNKGKKERQWEIRKQFHPQLQKLWEVNPELVLLKREPRVRSDGLYIQTLPHHQTDSKPLSRAIDGPPPVMQFTGDGVPYVDRQLPDLDLLEPIRRGSRTFFPLVRNTLALNCGLKIQFLRQEARGRLFNSGDLDGRIKLLLDALSVPQAENQMCDDPACPNPLFCLLENDNLVTAFDVQSEQLLSLPNQDENVVRLVVNVDVRVTRARNYNVFFLGE